jgi:organic hydroperoxide reductase OsmC/OhrA
MKNQHTFEASLTWEKKQLTPDNTTKISSKSHIVHIVGKPELAISAAKAFKGDPNLYNPEDLLLSSLVSCHMMSYLYVCEKYQIEILSYTDHAQAVLETYADGSGKIIEVTLHPEVVLKEGSPVQQAVALHEEAHKLCFIANSCNFPVRWQANCSIEK